MAQDCNVLIPVSEEQDLLMIDEKAPLLGTHTYGVCWDGQNWYRSGEFWPFRVNITGKVVSSVDTNGNVIVTIKNLRMIPSGVGTSYYHTRKYYVPWYGSTTSAVPAYRSVALAVVNGQYVPGQNDAAWHKCLGGWYTHGVTCGTACIVDRYGNKPGGTWGWFNDRDGVGAPYDKSNGQSFARSVPDQTWNLGPIAPTDGNTAVVWVVAHWQQGVGYNLGCNQPFAGNSYVAGIPIRIPVLKLCPPELDHEEQDDRVCDNCVDSELCFAPSDLGGQASVNLTVEYKYAGQGWDKAMSISTTAYKNQEACVTMACLLGDRDVDWRARYELNSGWSATSDWTYGKTHTLFIPSVGMIVPDISNHECTLISQGKCVEHFQNEVSYA